MGGNRWLNKQFPSIVHFPLEKHCSLEVWWPAVWMPSSSFCLLCAIAQQLSQWKSLPQVKPFGQWKRALTNGRLLNVDSRYSCCYQLHVFSLTWADSALSLWNDGIARCLYSIEYWQLNQPRWCDRFSLKIVKWKVLCSHLVMLNSIPSAADKALSEWKGNSIKTFAKLASWEH